MSGKYIGEASIVRKGVLLLCHRLGDRHNDFSFNPVARSIVAVSYLALRVRTDRKQNYT